MSGDPTDFLTGRKGGNAGEKAMSHQERALESARRKVEESRRFRTKILIALVIYLVGFGAWYFLTQGDERSGPDPVTVAGREFDNFVYCSLTPNMGSFSQEGRSQIERYVRENWGVAQFSFIAMNCDPARQPAKTIFVATVARPETGGCEATTDVTLILPPSSAGGAPVQFNRLPATVKRAQLCEQANSPNETVLMMTKELEALVQSRSR